MVRVAIVPFAAAPAAHDSCSQSMPNASATGLLSRSEKELPASFIKTIEYLLVTKSWWDTVDTISGGPLGVHFMRFPDVRDKYLAKWRASENFWLRTGNVRTCWDCGARRSRSASCCYPASFVAAAPLRLPAKPARRTIIAVDERLTAPDENDYVSNR